MKIRNGFVSNSSSSSFLVTQDLTDKGITCLKLTLAQKKLINGSKIYDNLIINIADINKDLYLTQFISDCTSKYDIIKNVEHIEYIEGQLSEEPRDEEYFNEYQVNKYGTSVYLLKEHDEAKQMKFSTFARNFKKDYDNVDVLVQYKNDEIILKVVR